VSLDIKNGLVPTFGRHETFTLRYAWLKRGYDAVAKPYEWCRHRPDYEPYIFEEPDAHHRLGVGKNMAKSIRFWLQACRVVEEVPVPGQRHRVGIPTRFGGALLGDSEKVGLDPYTEQLGSWWLLHWMMLSPGGYLPVWWIIFHTLPAVTFTTEQLVEHVQAQVEATSAWQARRSVHPSTLRKDVLALLRNYAGTTGGRRRELVDDVLDAPFVPLTLIRPTAEVNTFRFGVGPKPGLPPAVAAFACLDFLARTHSTGRQALVATLATEQGVSQGRRYVFQANPTIAMRGRQMAVFADQSLRMERFGVVSQPEGTLSHTLAESFRAEVERRGGRVVFSDTLDGLRAWSRLNERVRASAMANVEAVYMPVSGGDAGRYVQAVLTALDRADVPRLRLLGNGEWHDLPIEETASRYRVTYSNAFRVAPSAPQVQAFIERYRQAYGQTPDQRSATGRRLAYTGRDVTRFLLAARRRASGEADAPSSLPAILREAPRFDGLGLRINFEGANVNEAMFYHRYRSGRLELLR